MVGTNDIKHSLKLYDKILPFAGMKKLFFILQNLLIGKMLLLVMVQ